MKIHWFLLGGVAAMLAACASSAPIRWAPSTDFVLAITDNPAQQRFDLELVSKAAMPLCLPKESWPTEMDLPLGFDGATLITASGRKQLLPTGSAYCPGGCGYARVQPGQVLRGAIPYAAFGDSTAIAGESDRQLTFEVHPFVCSK